MIEISNGLGRFGVVLVSVFLLVLLSGCGKKTVAVPSAGHGSGYGTVSSAKALKVVRTARAQVGRPYKWGGSSPEEGFDCSGLVWWVFRRHGVDVPRVSWQQARAGRAVPKRSLAAGDIVLFRIPGQGKSLHAGIYSGKGAFFIHSPKSGHYVREESMAKAYWQRYFIGARRVL